MGGSEQAEAGGREKGPEKWLPTLRSQQGRRGEPLQRPERSPHRNGRTGPQPSTGARRGEGRQQARQRASGGT